MLKSLKITRKLDTVTSGLTKLSKLRQRCLIVDVGFDINMFAKDFSIQHRKNRCPYLIIYFIIMSS